MYVTEMLIAWLYQSILYPSLNVQNDRVLSSAKHIVNLVSFVSILPDSDSEITTLFPIKLLHSPNCNLIIFVKLQIC